ncbi:MAG TPA: EAL domain-containing protein [Treponemataceae bacterium]|nr:EAL domain-containing protein [Treponemataceae bacterium]
MNPDTVYRSILDRMPQLVLAASVVSSPDGGIHDFRITYVNKAWETLTGSLTATVENKLFSETVYANSGIAWVDAAGRLFSGKTDVHSVQFSELLEKWLDFRFTLLDEQTLMVTIDDVTEARQAETRLKEQNLRLSALSAELAESKKNLKVKLERIENLNSNLEQIAFFDRLTGLPNRLRFTAVLTAQIEEARRKDERIALAILDVDNLKTLNDSLGHEAGDAVLAQMGARLKAYECDTILASRFGGDEFLIIFREFEHEAEMLHVINAIREDLEKNYSWEDAPLHSSVSTGAAIFPDDADTLENLLKYADIAMTDAKRRGKNTLSLFHSVMQENLMNRLKMESRMTDTLEKGLFQVYFQPQVDSITGDLKGFEALVRWFDTELGYISPDRFIPLAEESKIIIALGDWILDTVCRILASWRSELGFTGTVSVNISPVQLKCRDFTEKLKRTLDKYGIDPEAIEIEITEGILIDNFDQVIEILNVIKKMGMRISLDDFGTGYSSLSYLQFIPLDTLKIDKSFIANITRDGRIEYEITNAIVTLVNKLGLNTIAEGVETKEQMDVIRAIKCRTAQGFYTGKPAPAIECERLIRSGGYSGVPR